MNIITEKKSKISSEAKETRNKLTKAALPLFLRHGYDGTGINQILKTAQLSKGAFYHHFSSKAQIYEEVIPNFFLDPINDLNIEEIAKLPLKGIRKSLSDHYSFLPNRVTLGSDIDMMRYYAAFYEALSRLPDFKASINNHYSALIEIIANKTNEEREIFPKVANTHARNVISTLEGKLLLNLLSPKDSVKNEKNNGIK